MYNLERMIHVLTGYLGVPTIEGITTSGSDFPANPALRYDDPLSMTIHLSVDSAMERQLEEEPIQYV